MELAKAVSPRRLRGLHIALGLLVLVAYAGVVAIFADRKLMWTDEVLTLWVALQPTVHDLFAEMYRGTDVLPPLHHLLTRFSVHFLGHTHIAYRLVPAIGYGAGLIAVFQVLKLDRGRVASYAAVLFMVSVPAFAYAYEARPYGVLVGSCAVAILSWYRASLSGKWFWYAILGLSLSAAVLNHWYGVLTPVPIVAGEWQRLWRHRRVDVRMLLALGLPALALFSVRSFLEPAMMYQAMEPPPGNLGAYLFEHYNLTAGGITTAVVLGLSCLVQRRNGQAEQSISSALFTVAATAAALPLLSFVAGHLSGGMSAARYVLHSTVGLGLLVGFFTAGLAKSSRLHAAAALGFLTVLALATTAERKFSLGERSMIEEGEGRFSLFKVALEHLEPAAPIVVPDFHVFLQLYFYAPDPFKSRLVYPDGFNPMESMIKLASEPIRVLSIDQLRAGWKAFYVYDVRGNHDTNPVLPALVTRGAIITDSGVIDPGINFPRPGCLYLVKWP